MRRRTSTRLGSADQPIATLARAMFSNVSKAFTKDDAWEEPVVPARAPLPDGVPNYVTPHGFAALRAELSELEAERRGLDQLERDDAEVRRRVAIVGKRLSDLTARLASAQVVDPRAASTDVVRFGATVTLRTIEGAHAGEERQLQLVGVDEADAAHGRVAFTSPIARAVIGLQVGETSALQTAHGEDLLLVVSIAY